MDTVSWQNSTLLTGDVAEAVERLKRGDGGEIQVYGSGTLVQTLVEHDLVDEFYLLTMPVQAAMVDGPDTALAEVASLEQDQRLAGYRYLPAIKADLLRRLGRDAAAAAEYERALALADNETERAFLASRLAELSGRLQ